MSITAGLMSLPEFQRFQRAFTAHIRNPTENSLPYGIEARRMEIYRKLVYSNIENFLLACFPVLYNVLGKRRWEWLVHRFIARHRSHSPYFRQIPEEFIQFLQGFDALPARYPEFAVELAHYEWVELALSVSAEAADWERIDQEGGLLEYRPVLNPVLANLRYGWPVHRIAPRSRVTATETWLLVFRDASDEIRFMEINAFTSRLITLLELGRHTGQTALEIIVAESGHPSPEVVIQGGMEVMHELRRRGALLGIAK